MSDRLATAASGLALVALALGLQLLVSCGGDSADEQSESTAPTTAPTVPATATPDEPAEPTTAPLPPSGNPESLSEWGQLGVSDGRLVLADGVEPYALNSALFSDYAHKLRTVWLPEGAAPATYHPDDVFDFPVGTVITKTFYFPVHDGAAVDGRVLKVAVDDAGLAGPLDLATVRLLETRVLVRRADGWHALPYVWNDEQTEATLRRAGDLLSLTLVDEAGGGAETPFVYVVPDVNQCSSCHATNHTSGEIQPIGPKARHLNTDVDRGDGMVSQLGLWVDSGLLGEAPPTTEIPMAAVWDDDTATTEARARSYLDINCAHCHNSSGSADTSGLFLEPSTDLGTEFGLCKAPIAAGTGTGGRLVGIHPGEPDESIFVFRMETSDPAAMMPEVGRSLTHVEGVDLISTWIASLPGSC